MKLWQKELEIEKKVENFTIGNDNELDLALAPFDVWGSIAHTKMLNSINLLTNHETTDLVLELQRILKEDIETGKFVIEPGIEDVHSQIELELTRKLGDTGKKIHSGRSRNDQVLVDLRLFFRHKIENIVVGLEKLAKMFLELSEQYKDVLMPGYTHMQIAMPSSFGLWFSAFAESLVDDITYWQSIYKIINQNPLGSAAGYGSSFPLNRTLTTELLGFESLSFNVINAQYGRGRSEYFLATGLSASALTMNKLASDVCLYIGQNHGFIKFPDELTTGSSIMPHKKNPDVFELTRSKTNQLISLPNEIAQMTSNLSTGYHRDFQLLKESLFKGIDTMEQIIDIMLFVMPQIQINKNILNDPKYQFLYSVEVVNKLVMEGIPFRDAYKQVGMDIENNNFNPSTNINHSHEGSIGNLCLSEIENKLAQSVKAFNFKSVKQKIEALLH